MATTTPNFGWAVPTSTDLVKDGATAIETLGDSIDASLVDLKGGSTGQVLAKATNTDMDFTWVTNAGDIEGVTAGVGITGGGTSGTVTITNDMATTITASGDIIVGTGSGTYDNLPIGTTGQVLTADTTVSPYKVKWATAGASKNFTLVNTGGTALSGTITTVSGISDADELLVLVVGGSINTGGGVIGITLNNDTNSTKYTAAGNVIEGRATYSTASVDDINSWQAQPGSHFRAVLVGNNAAATFSIGMRISGCNSTNVKVMDLNSGSSVVSSSTGQTVINTTGTYSGTSAITSVEIRSFTGGYTFDAGTVYVYKSA